MLLYVAEVLRMLLHYMSTREVYYFLTAVWQQVVRGHLRRQIRFEKLRLHTCLGKVCTSVDRKSPIMHMLMQWLPIRAKGLSEMARPEVRGLSPFSWQIVTKRPIALGDRIANTPAMQVVYFMVSTMTDTNGHNAPRYILQLACNHTESPPSNPLSALGRDWSSFSVFDRFSNNLQSLRFLIKNGY